MIQVALSVTVCPHDVAMCAVVRAHRISCQLNSPYFAVHSSWVHRDEEPYGKKCCRWEEMQCLCITRLISPPFLFVEHMKAHEWIWALWRVVYVCQGRAPYVWVKYVLMLESHVLPDSMVTNPPFFANISTLSGFIRQGLHRIRQPPRSWHAFIH